MPSMSWGWILIFAIVFGLMGTPAMANRIARRRGHPRAFARGQGCGGVLACLALIALAVLIGIARGL